MSSVATSSNPLLVSQTCGVLRITLNRPDRRNALSESLVSDLSAAIEQAANDPAVRVVVLAANGPAFCAGHDLSEMTGRSEPEYRNLFARCAGLMRRLRSLAVPVIAVVQGLATGAGCQLAAACDLVIATTEAGFATPGVKLGLFCTTPMVPLVRSIPAKPAMEMLLTGTPISAQRAYELGLVNRVVPADQLDATLSEFTSAIEASSPLTIRIGKRAFYDQIGIEEGEAWDRAVPIMTDNALRQDAQEGMSAFVQKRSPRWTGE
jgi:enoyl-CoA hydratase/carnithine racemase